MARLSNVHSVHVHMTRPHHQAVVKIVMLKFVIEVWLKCIEIMTTEKEVVSFYGEKNCGGPAKQCTLWKDRLIRPCLYR